MKLNFEKHKWHAIIMVICFIYGGISLVVFALQANSLIQAEKLEQHINERVNNQETQVNESDFGSPLFSQRQHLDSNFSRIGFWGLRRTSFSYHVMFLSLLGSIVSILAALSLMDLLRKKERKEITRDVVDSMIMPDEKIVIKELERNNGELTQSDLVRKTKLSKVKVHRIIKRLESLGIVSKYPYGVTNKIKLEKSLYEE